MFKNKITILILIISTLFIGCGYKTTNTQIRDKSFIKFNKKSTESFNVIVNDNYKFELKSCIIDEETNGCYDKTKNELYEVKSGNINIKVYNSDNILILDKNIFVGSNNTVEVDL
jgi:Na+-translocating ferredoxin:NAD+ oxidoreductase RnfG subunit